VGTDAVPAHLRPRIEVIGNDKKSLGSEPRSGPAPGETGAGQGQARAG